MSPRVAQICGEPITKSGINLHTHQKRERNEEAIFFFSRFRLQFYCLPFFWVNQFFLTEASFLSEVWFLPEGSVLVGNG